MNPSAIGWTLCPLVSRAPLEAVPGVAAALLPVPAP